MSSKDKYTDYVLARRHGFFRDELFVAPAFSQLKREDVIIVEPDGFNQMAKVIACITVADERLTDIEFVMSATKTDTKPKRVLSKVNYKIFDYTEGKDDD